MLGSVELVGNFQQFVQSLLRDRDCLWFVGLRRSAIDCLLPPQIMHEADEKKKADCLLSNI
jgi:hypothetical protein